MAAALLGVLACDAETIPEPPTCTAAGIGTNPSYIAPNLPPSGQQCVSEGLEVCGVMSHGVGVPETVRWSRCENAVWTSFESTAACDQSRTCPDRVTLGDCCGPPDNCGTDSDEEGPLYCDGYEWRRLE